MTITKTALPHLAKAGQLGAITIPNRVLMAATTRNRAIGTVPNDVMTKFYAQRAGLTGAGLIITEGILISPQGTEWPHAPALWNDEHVANWKKVVDAVHAKGTPIVAQLWHVGRASHPDAPEQKKAETPVYGPSAIAARGGLFRTIEGQPGYVTPTALDEASIAKTLDEFSRAAKLAQQAGFDGVELHGANGYLPDQFLSDTSNVRTDRWGGSIENRARFTLEATKRLIDVYGADRVGVKLAPGGGYNDMYYTSTESRLATFKYITSALDALKIAFLEICRYSAYGDPKYDGVPVGYDHDVEGTYGPLIKHSKLVANCGIEAEEAERLVASGKAEAVTFARNFVNNPDYFRRVEEGLPVNREMNYMLLQGGKGSDLNEGYTDYPFAE
ncbi:hypothetical protein IAT38_001065 [Cryptococcus sp. DSM 104549]